MQLTKNGRRTWTLSKSTKDKMAASHIGVKNPMWRGDIVGYSALHAWIKRHKIKSVNCEMCQNTKPLDLANISGEYKRELSDWEWLCRKCHMTKDGRMKDLVKKTIERIRVEIDGKICCSVCKIYKEKNEFYPNNSRPHKVQSHCKKCFLIAKKSRSLAKVSYCPHCISATHTINYVCGKCKKSKRIYKKVRR